MTDKKNICRYDDYIESKALAGSYHTSPLHNVLHQFKLDRIFPRNINIKLNQETIEGLAGNSIKYADSKNAGEGGKGIGEVGRNGGGQAFKLFNSSENKFYH